MATLKSIKNKNLCSLTRIKKSYLAVLTNHFFVVSVILVSVMMGYVSMFNGLNTEELKISGKLSPKILIIAPNKRLSWQYHHRRSEIWKVVNGQIKVVTSHDDVERKEKILKEGDEIRLYKGERHRIIGLEEYAVVAEIWIHTDKDNPSDENDIVRVQDDFNRN